MPYHERLSGDSAYVVWMAVIYVLVNLVVDLLYHWLDPRVRLGGEKA